MPAQGEQSISARTVTTRDPGLYIPSCPCLDRRMRHMASVKKCARARWTRSFGSRFRVQVCDEPEYHKRFSYFSDSGNGSSASDLGDPYRRVGTCQSRHSDSDKGNLERRMKGLACWVYSRRIPLRLVLMIYEISCHVGPASWKLHL